MTTRLAGLCALVILGWFVAPGDAMACPLCYGGDDPATGRATIWAGAVLVVTAYGLLAAGAVWTWRRRQSVRSGDDG